MAPFWGEVIKSAFTAEGVSGLLKAGWSTIKVRRRRRRGGLAACLSRRCQACRERRRACMRTLHGAAAAAAAAPLLMPTARTHPSAFARLFIQGALVMPLMARGFQLGLVKFVLITGRKPAP